MEKISRYPVILLVHVNSIVYFLPSHTEDIPLFSHWYWFTLILLNVFNFLLIVLIPSHFPNITALHQFPDKLLHLSMSSAFCFSSQVKLITFRLVPLSTPVPFPTPPVPSYSFPGVREGTGQVPSRFLSSFQGNTKKKITKS